MFSPLFSFLCGCALCVRRVKYEPHAVFRQRFWRTQLVQFDADKSGTFSRSEIIALLADLGLAIDPLVLKEFFTRFDKDVERDDLSFEEALMCLEGEMGLRPSGSPAPPPRAEKVEKGKGKGVEEDVFQSRPLSPSGSGEAQPVSSPTEEPHPEPERGLEPIVQDAQDAADVSKELGMKDALLSDSDGEVEVDHKPATIEEAEEPEEDKEDKGDAPLSSSNPAELVERTDPFESVYSPEHAEPEPEHGLELTESFELVDPVPVESTPHETPYVDALETPLPLTPLPLSEDAVPGTPFETPYVDAVEEPPASSSSAEDVLVVEPAPALGHDLNLGGGESSAGHRDEDVPSSPVPPPSPSIVITDGDTSMEIFPVRPLPLSSHH